MRPKKLAAALALLVLTVVPACGTGPGSGAGPGYTPGQVEMIIPFNPGGGVDLAGRAVVEHLRSSGAVDTNPQISNMPGGSGAIGMNTMRGTKAGDPDTLMTIATHVITTPIQQGQPEQLDQLTPLARLFTEYGVVVVPADSPWRTASDLAAALRADPGRVRFGGGSAGSVDEVLAIAVVEAAGVPRAGLTYVPYDGGESVAAVLGGQLDVAVGGFDLLDLVAAGELRALGVAAPQRLPGQAAGIPTLREQGLDVEVRNWRGVFGPRDMPQAAADHWRTALRTMSESPGWKEFLATNGFVADFDTAGFPAFLAEQDVQFRRLLGAGS